MVAAERHLWTAIGLAGDDAMERAQEMRGHHLCGRQAGPTKVSPSGATPLTCHQPGDTAAAIVLLMLLVTNKIPVVAATVFAAVA
jgi:hypothetical protein